MDATEKNALDTLYSVYNCVFRIELDADRYSIVKPDKEYTFPPLPYSALLRRLIEHGWIHKDDQREVEARADLEKLRQFFRGDAVGFIISYRRRMGDAYRWVGAEFLRSAGTVPEENVVYLFVKDINDSYSPEADQRRELEYWCNHDTLTDLRNHYAYRSLLLRYAAYTQVKQVGVIFADLNGLKVVNDLYGHDAGNHLIQRFASILKKLFDPECVYRVSGDEFCVLLTDTPGNVVRERYQTLLEQNAAEIVPLASAGMAWSEETGDIEDVIRKAEREMYLAKQAFYEQYPDLKRSSIDRSYASEMNAVVMNLAEAYPTLGIINIANDTYRLLKFDREIGHTFSGSNYSEYCAVFMNELITEKSRERIRDLIGVHNLKRVLKNLNAVSAYFKMREGSWRQITFRTIETDANGPGKVMFYAERLGEELSAVLEKEYGG